MQQGVQQQTLAGDADFGARRGRDQFAIGVAHDDIAQAKRGAAFGVALEYGAADLNLMFAAEILLVNDASTDRSPAILDAYQAAHPEIVRVLHHQANRGITGACQTLYDNARGDYIFINGSDGQWKTAESLRMMALRDRYDLIVGRRRRKRYDWKRSAISMAFNLLPWILFGVRTYDAGSIKLFRRDILDLPTTSFSDNSTWSPLCTLVICSGTLSQT